MKKSFFYILSILIFFGCVVPMPVDADWINLSGAENAPNIAEIHINNDHVKIDLEIFVNDMVTFGYAARQQVARTAQHGFAQSNQK